MMSPRLSAPGGFGSRNGAHGVFSPPQSPTAFHKARLPSVPSSRPTSGNFSAVKSFKKRAKGSGGYKIGFVQESAMSLQRRSMADLGAGIYQGVTGVSYITFLEWIRSERLTTLPHKGSRWDKVLIRSLYFAEQLNKFDQAIQAFALDSSAAAAIGYGHARLLLELGHENSAALDKAFSVFYRFALSFSKVLSRSELLTATSEVREQLCLLYTDFLSLVVDVAIRFYKTANGMISGSVSFDIFELFGETIEAFYTRQNAVVDLIWESQIQGEDLEDGEALDVKVLSRWLSPQDRVLATLNRDHSFFVDQQVEFTCLWFQKHLTKFLQSDKTFFLVTGQPGAGKTTLAGSIVERLQRPVNRKQVDTLFCSLSPDIPTTATSLAVVKSLLSQLLSIRVGNVDMYYALLRAYHQCRTSADLTTYEDQLWSALTDTLKHPLEGGNDLIMVVDGLDEIAESQSASIQAAGAISPSALLEKLANITKETRGVRLIALSSSIKMPSHANGLQHQITPDDIHDDLHAVALRALVRNTHFHGKPANEQETMLGRIIQAANGSFLWTILVCENLNSQKSSDAMTKTLASLESSKPSVQDLVLKLFTSLDTTSNAKTVLSWIMAAERPLTVEEIHTLFTIDTGRGTLSSDKGVNVNATIQSLKPLLTLHEHIIRFKHPIVHTALHDFAQQNKIPINLQDSETDLLLRVLTYAKSTLRDKGEPLIDNHDPTMSDRLFNQHHFLEYTVRYWVLHLQQSPLAPKPSGEFKPNADLQKALPDTTILAILEQLVWDTELPIPQAIDLHKLVGTVRRTIFTDNHPSVLQTYLAVATSYLLIANTTEAQKYFYLCTQISTKVLSDIHPLTLECATQFLTITESMGTSTRTEVTTRREEILLILIAAYERQYGSTSELVIQTRKLLVELYASINEEERAMEVYRLIQDATVQQYGRNSHQAQDVQGHLSVVLGKGRGERTLDGYKESFFHDDHDEEETVETFDIASVVAYLRRAESYASRKEVALSEKTYVELWQEVSSRCRGSLSVEWHEKNIEIATAYSQFLKTQKRSSEASAILTCVWQQYEHHQLAYSENIVAHLTSIAKEMKSIGSYAQALSIFRHANSYYQNMHQEETNISREVSKQVSETSTELVKQSLVSSSTTTETTTISESVYQDVFFSVIKSSKTVESSTIALAKKLTARYMEQRNWTAAINIIHTTLQRTWSSFFANSIQDVSFASIFTQESIELVERVAECYLHTKQLEKVEDTYKRFFRATSVTQNVDKTIFEKSRSLLITFYDKHGHADSAISVYQDILVAYRTSLGPAHELTIQTLYNLARRCQSHPRNHPYWIEYYLQVITTLNKDSDVCHKDALDAIIVVTETYWQDRRYAEAVVVYRVLWNTYTRNTKEHKVFSDAKFVQKLYEHYYQCLEETKAGWATLYEVTKQYRDTSTITFGAESTVAVEATLALAQVSQRSEEHLSQAIALYEEASKSKTTTTRTTVSDMRQALSSLYVRQLRSQSSSNYKSETIQRAMSMTQEQLTESISKYGYSHESSLASLKELAVLYHRQQKTDVAVKSLTTAAADIVTKETSSQKQIESAAALSSSFLAIQQSSAAHSLVEELHRQIIAKDARSASKWSFDLTKTSRTALAFLASLQYNLRSDFSVTFAEIMSDLTMEYIYFEQFRTTLQNNESVKNILLAAAPLRYFLRRNKQADMVTVVEEQAVGLFAKRDAADLNTLSKESPRIFIIGILDYLGNGRNKNFDRSVILASNESVTKLTKEKKFAEAYDLANLGFLYASKYDGYNGPRSISLGFKLASVLVGRDSEKTTDAPLRKKTLQLSNRIVKKILEISKKLDINFAQVQLYELSHLSGLLGEQQDYETLEWLLKTLWSTRDAQRSWPAEVLLNLGRRLICARFLAGHSIKAIRLCEDIAYNMRRAHGPRSPATIETYELLAQLYTSTAQSYQAKASSEKTGPLAQEYFRKAVGVHEDILRLVVHEHGSGSGDDSDDELDTAAYLLAKEGVSVGSQDGKQTDSLDQGSVDRSAVALRHLHLLKLAYQRLGGWPKPYHEYEQLNAYLFREFGSDPKWKGVQGTETWDAKTFGSGKAESQDGAFTVIADWGFGSDAVLLQAQGQGQPQSNGANGANGNGLSSGSNGLGNGSNGSNSLSDGSNGFAKMQGQQRQQVKA
ncbi:hypothetical protein BDV95DRAFT_504119 [Massariosphaeria phaeospora]|uniref:Nephrocystin 3-like N-terminal domain-containing protein n=1 Tax=Massariosphaeria phaeospora TaxID=100035 RepID=A0A7C8I4D0_9PLEO|nr:hypothetical protein BDV95DRAFT_504119 [Massariosphaeria phaeospora]